MDPIALFGITILGLQAIVIYLFYARLKDIGDELRKLRILKEIEMDPGRSSPQFPHEEA